MLDSYHMVVLYDNYIEQHVFGHGVFARLRGYGEGSFRVKIQRIIGEVSEAVGFVLFRLLAKTEVISSQKL